LRLSITTTKVFTKSFLKAGIPVLVTTVDDAS
jgi:hypothetical protein